MPVDECAKFDAVMAAWESAAERGWRGDRDVALLAEPAAWLRVINAGFSAGPPVPFFIRLQTYRCAALIDVEGP